MFAKPRHCISCPLETRGDGYVPGIGPPGFLLLGGAPEQSEVALGEPFRGPSGRWLDWALRLAGIRREDCLLDSTVRCRPSNDWLLGAPWQHGAVEHCGHLNAAAIHASKTLVAAGAVALKRLLPELNAGTLAARGYAIPRIGGQWVVPTFHPSYVMQGKAAFLPVMAADLAKAWRIHTKGYVEDPEDYLTHPSYDEFLRFERGYDPSLPLAVDIETPTSVLNENEESHHEDPSYVIVRCSFAYREHQAVSIPWSPPYTFLARRLIERASKLVFWNAPFDVPRLKHDGCVIPDDRVRDAMQAWIYLKPGFSAGTEIRKAMPNRLSFVTPFYCNRRPWKHLSESAPEYYSCVDSDVTLTNMNGIEAALRKQSRWESYLENVERFIPLIRTVGANGIPIDPERQKAVKADLEQSISKDLDDVLSKVPKELWPRKLYKGIPQEFRCSYCKGRGYLKCTDWKSATRRKKHHDDANGCLGCRGRGYLDPPCDGWVREEGTWSRIEPFNPSSRLQLEALLKHLGIPIPRHRKTGKDSIGNEDLRRIKHPVMKSIVDYREASKLVSSFIYPVDSRGRVTTEYQFTSTGRLRSKNPNLQNVPKRSQIANKLRSCFVAPEGWEFLEIDYSAIEAVLTGYFAEDGEYMELAKLGVHTKLASLALGLPVEHTPEDFKRIKKIASATYLPGTTTSYYDAAKRTVHGANYRMGARLLHMTYPEIFVSQAKAQEWLDRYFAEIATRIQNWQNRIIAMAEKQHYLVNPFGYILEFWDVKAWNQKLGKMVQGDGANRAVAFLPQSTAAAIIRRAVADHAEYIHSGNLLLTVHDQLLFMFPEECIEERAREIIPKMCRPIPELGGLTIDVEAERGPVWSKEDTFGGRNLRPL